MPSVSFFISSPKTSDGKLKSAPCRIYFDIIESRKDRYRMKSIFRVSPKDWNFSKQEVKYSAENAGQINTYLAETKAEILDAFAKNRSMDFQQVIGQILSKNNLSKTDNEVKEVYHQWIQSMHETLSERTVKKHRSIEKHLVHGSFSDYDLKFYDELVDRFIQEGKVNDTISKIIGSFRTFFAWSMHRGYHENRIFERHKIGPTRSVRNEIVALTSEECEALAALPLEGNHDHIRNLFLLSCHSGARWSDVIAITSSQITETAWKFEAWKTRKQKRLVVVPFLNWCAPVLEYANKVIEFQHRFTEQYVNRQLKSICEMAGIDEKIRTTRMSGQRQVVREKEKWQYVSFHTGRRTFISVLLNKGMPAPTVMKLTGISSMKTLMKYLDTTEDDVARELRNL